MSPATVTKRDNGKRDAVNAATNNEPEKSFECNHEHFAMAIVDEVLNIGIEEIHTMLFTDSPLFREFIRRRKTYDVKLADWSTEPNEQGCKLRNISYTLTLSQQLGFGPKTSSSTEKQILYPESKPGERYLIDAECYNGGVPYSDSFCTVIRYCMTQTGPTETRLIITGQVVYLKHIMGLVKSLLQKTAISGCSDSFSVMVELLRQESESRSRPQPNRPSSLTLRKRNRINGLSDTPSSKQSPISADDNSQHRSSIASSVFQSGSENDDTAFINGNNNWDSRTLSSESTTTKSRGVMKLFQYLSSAGSSSESFELLVVLLFMIVLILIIINAALFYQVTVLETILNRLLSFNRGG